MNKKLRIPLLAAVAMIAFLLTGCKDDGPSAKSYVQNGAQMPLRIALLDFTNLVPRSDEAGRVVTNAVLTYLLSNGGFEIVEPGVVDEVMREKRIVPPPTGLDSKSAKQLQEALNVDAILTGAVEEYGDIRIGNDSYPSVSFSARLINARNSTIVWAGMISRTGADKVLIFDIRRISSMGKLVKSAVAEMASSIHHDQDRILTALTKNGSANIASDEPGPADGSSLPVAADAAPEVSTAVASSTPEVSNAAVTTATNGGAASDENKTYTAEELQALLPDVEGYTKKEPVYSKHYHATLTAQYQIGDGPNSVEVKLVDYLKLIQTQKFLQTAHDGETVGEFQGLPAFVSDSQFNYTHIDAALGRFGLYIRGPIAKRAEVEGLAKGIILALR